MKAAEKLEEIWEILEAPTAEGWWPYDSKQIFEANIEAKHKIKRTIESLKGEQNE